MKYKEALEKLSRYENASVTTEWKTQEIINEYCVVATLYVHVHGQPGRPGIGLMYNAYPDSTLPSIEDAITKAIEHYIELDVQTVLWV